MVFDWQDEIDIAEIMYPGEGLDRVIVRWLALGDTRPLAWALRQGKPLGAKTLRYLGMMLDGDAAYRLEAVRSDGRKGNAPKPANLMRDLELSSLVAGLRHDVGSTYEETIRAVAERLGVSESTVRDACTRHKQSID